MIINPTEPNTLRTKAEAHLSHAPATESLVYTNEKLLLELQVHQVQLEMQNEELRRMHIALEESHASYVELYELAPVGYLTLTHNGLIDKINLTATQLLGVSRNTVLSRRFAALITAKDGDNWHIFFSKVMKHNKRLSIELMLKGFSDTEIPVQLDCVCVDSMLRVTMTDITKIKQAEALAIITAERMQTEKALNRLQKIASQLPGVVFQFRLRADGSSCFPYASDAIRNIYRLSPEEVREDASKVFALIHPDDYDDIITAIRKSEWDLSPWRHEYRVKFDDGTVRWLSGNALLQREADGSTLWHGFITDITESRQVEIALRESNRLLDLSMQMSRMGSWDYNPVDCIAKRTLEHDRIFGYESLLPQWNYEIFLDHVLPEDRFEVDRLVQKAILTREGVNFECRIRRADGEIRWYCSSADLISTATEEWRACTESCRTSPNGNARIRCYEIRTPSWRLPSLWQKKLTSPNRLFFPG